MANLKLQVTTFVTLAIILHIPYVAAQNCVPVDGYQRFQQDILQCTITESSDYSAIPSDTEALWIIYPQDNSIQLTIDETFPPMPNLKLLITDITYLNDTDFQPGAFTNTDMPLLETFIIVRDSTVPQNYNRYFLILDDSFLGLGHIQNLYLDSLAIYELQVNSLTGLDNLKMLSLKQNYLTYILPNTFLHTPNLTSLILHNNYINELDNNSFTGLSNLSRLDLSLNDFNHLQTGPLRHLENLEIIDLSNNNIDSIEAGTFGGLSKLHYLAINSNSLSEISIDTFQGLTILETLILDSNKVELAPNLFSNLGSLWHISLSNNRIRNIEASYFSGLENLNELFLSDNLIYTISNGTFAGLPALEKLDLDSNRIATIEMNGFRGLDNLVKFSIQGNNLTTLMDGVFAPFSNLDTIYLNDNHWVCDCNIDWLITWLRERYDDVEPHEQWQEIRCGTNDPIANVTFLELIQQEYHFTDLCETTSVSQTSPVIVQSTTLIPTIEKTTQKGGRYKNEVLDDKAKIILSVCLIGIALIAFIVIITLVHIKQRKNRIWQPPDKKQTEQQRNELINKSQTSVPSFYPDPDSGHGSSTWEIRQGDEEPETTAPNVPSPEHAKGALRLQHQYLNRGLATDSTETLNSPDKRDNIRPRKNSMTSAYSVYSYEGEYYKDGLEKEYDTPETPVTMTPGATPARFRTITADSIDRNYPNSERSSHDTNLQTHSSDGASVQYADIVREQNGGSTTSGYHSQHSTSAGSDDRLLPTKRGAVSSLRTDTSSEPENSSSTAFELKEVPAKPNVKTVMNKLMDLNYVDLDNSPSPEAEDARNSFPLSNETEIEEESSFSNNGNHGKRRNTIVTMETDPDTSEGLTDVAL